YLPPGRDLRLRRACRRISRDARAPLSPLKAPAPRTLCPDGDPGSGRYTGRDDDPPECSIKGFTAAQKGWSTQSRSRFLRSRPCSPSRTFLSEFSGCAYGRLTEPAEHRGMALRFPVSPALEHERRVSLFGSQVRLLIGQPTRGGLPSPEAMGIQI